MEDESTPEILSREFFAAANLPTSTHEEWLLRVCSQLMHREAAAVSVLEYQAQQAQSATQGGRRRGRRWNGRNSSDASGGCDGA
jgi:hypothetical protein